MQKITRLLARKQPDFHTISPTASLNDAVHQMCCENVDYLVVLNENEQFVGVLSEHDITLKSVSTSLTPIDKLKVKDVMNTRLPVATTNDSIERCMQVMKQFSVRLLPVFDGLQFRGVVTAEDIIQEAVYSRMKIFDEDPAASYA